MTAPRPEVTVIIATRNRAHDVGRAVERLVEQRTGGRFTYEILVVDNGSTDQTRDVVQALQARFDNVRYLFEPTAGKPWALNRGIREAQGELLAFTDDDLLAEPTWLLGLWQALQDGAEAVTGRVLPCWLGRRPDWLTDGAVRRLGLGCIDYGTRRRTPAEGDCRWVGGSLAMRRDVAERIGPFNVRLHREEDTNYYRRCLLQGVRIMYEPSSVTYHQVGQERTTPAYFRRWNRLAGYYRVHQLEWKPSHVFTVMPLWRAGITLQRVKAWLNTVMHRQPWWNRFDAELRVWEDLGLWWHRLQLWPRWALACVLGRPYVERD